MLIGIAGALVARFLVGLAGDDLITSFNIPTIVVA